MIGLKGADNEPAFSRIKSIMSPFRLSAYLSNAL
jgi:hypothetical protein